LKSIKNYYYDHFIRSNSVTKSKTIRWAGLLARVGKKKISYVVCVRKVKERNSLETLSVEGKNENSSKETG